MHADGTEWRGQHYRSLSVVARERSPGRPLVGPALLTVRSRITRMERRIASWLRVSRCTF
jgi:hypothetical protein